nr:response regulator transcription factor [Bacillus xiamenensis]
MIMKYQHIKLLVVDDEPAIVDFLTLGLENEGFQVKTATDGLSALNIVKTYQPHICILDVMMPGMDGYEVCKLMKKVCQISIIMLTAKDEVEYRIKGLCGGADDYMMKPFSFDELLARIQARLRNQFPYLLSDLSIGPFQVDDRRKEIRFNQKVLKLSATEYELLKLFIVNHGIVLSKSTILEKVWGYDFNGEDNIVEVYIRALRDKIGDKEHKMIRTLRSTGYRLDIQ